MERREAVLIVADWPLTKGAKEVITNSLLHGDADAVFSVAGHLKRIGNLLKHKLCSYPTLTNSTVAIMLRNYLDNVDLYPEAKELIDCWAIAIAMMAKGFKAEYAADFTSRNIRPRRK